MNKTVFILPFIVFALFAAIWSGWIRIGWSFPVTNAVAQHGALMVNSFLASLIFLERAVTFRNKWVLLLPLINALSAVAFVFNEATIAQLIFIAGSSGFVVICTYFLFRFREAYYFIFLVGALCLLIGNTILLRTNFYPNAVTWWMGFLLFTIVAERLELSRFLKLSDFKRSLLWLCLAGVFVALLLPFHSSGHIVLAAAIASTGIWLLRYDMARHSVKAKGQHRYCGWLLITGYAWLLIMSVLLIVQSQLTFGYDAVLHSFFIGFVFSMIFSHAVIILPAVTQLSVKLYRPVLYLWFVLLQASLVVRIVADVAEDSLCRRIAGMVSGITILLFFISIAVIMKSELGKRRQVKATTSFFLKAVSA
jgi:hypothetical protein